MTDQPLPFRTPAVELDEGAIFEGIPLPTWSKAGELQTVPRRVLITSHGCDCEDYLTACKKGMSDAAAKMRLHVAPLRQVDGSPKKLQQIRDGQVMPLFWVYGDDSMPPQILDLAKETSLPAAIVAKGRHLATIAEWQ